MYGFLNTLDKIKKYFAFTESEKKGLLVTILCLGLVLGMNDCLFLTKQQCTAMGPVSIPRLLFNVFNSILIVALGVLAFVTAQRVYGLDIGFRIEFQPWYYGLMAGLMISVMSYGAIPLLFTGGLYLHMMETHRLGYFRYHRSHSVIGLTAVMGPYANILLAIFFKSLSFLPGGLIHKAMMVNILLAVCNMLPFPPLAGGHAFFALRGFYLLTFGSILGMSLLLVYQNSITLTILGGVVFAFAFQHIFFRFIENSTAF